MKKHFALILAAAMLFLLTACAPKNAPIPVNDTDVNEQNETTPKPMDEAEQSDKNDASDEETPTDKQHTYPSVIEPECLYDPLVDLIFYEEGTFSEDYIRYMDGYHENEEEWGHARPALLWYLAQKMGLTRENFETYYASFDFRALGWRDEVPAKIYEGLMADTLEESMQLLKSDYAFYNDGKLYTVYEIFEMYEDDTLPFDITDSAYDEVWKNISSYYEMQKYGALPRELHLFVREHAHEPVWRIYFWHSGQYGYNVCTSYTPGSDGGCFSILECNTYETRVGSMNERYAPIIDGTVFIYDYLNGEKVCDIPLSPDGCHVDFIEFSSEEFPRYLSVTQELSFPEYTTRLYDIEKQEFVLCEPFGSCVIPKGTDLLCKTVESDGKYITTAYRVGTLEEVLSVEGRIFSAEIGGKTVLAAIDTDGLHSFYDTDGNELSGLDEYKFGYDIAPMWDHIIYGGVVTSLS